MMDVKVSVCGTKQELDEFCDRMGYVCQPFSNHRTGWSWTNVYDPEQDGKQIGMFRARECELECELPTQNSLLFITTAGICNQVFKERAKAKEAEAEDATQHP